MKDRLEAAVQSGLRANAEAEISFNMNGPLKRLESADNSGHLLRVKKAFPQQPTLKMHELKFHPIVFGIF